MGLFLIMIACSVIGWEATSAPIVAIKTILESNFSAVELEIWLSCGLSHRFLVHAPHDSASKHV